MVTPHGAETGRVVDVTDPTATAASPAATFPLRRHRGLLVSERKLLLAALDVGAVVVAYVAAFNIRSAEIQQAGFYVPRSGTLITAGMWLLAAQLAGAYDLRAAMRVRSTLRVVGLTLTLSIAGLLLVFFAAPYRITRPTILLWAPLAAVLVTGVRLLYRRTLTSHRLAHQVVLVATPEVQSTWPDIRSQCGNLYHLRHIIDPGKPSAADRLATVAASGTVSEVVLGTREDRLSRELFVALRRCYDSGLTVRSLGDLYEDITGRLLLDQLGASWLTSLPMRSETSRLYSTVKRLVDVAAAIVGLSLFGLLLGPIALLIKVDDGGPVFHRQPRVGKYGHVFQLTKLRTMRANAEGGTPWTERRDARVTRVGRVLRMLHVDELPQMWSILRGDMSLIGPRPEQPQYVQALSEQIDFYTTRLTVRPGLTGWAQVNYGYGSGVEGARVKLSYDLYYIERQSLSLDLLIMARTLLTVLSFKGR
jgi:exopolysaccharide biosynthesis polyprenyl glycosylphosphotransferase